MESVRGESVVNWLSATEARALWQSPDAKTLKGKRDCAIIAFLLGCGLRRRVGRPQFQSPSASRRSLAIVDPLCFRHPNFKR
jgi:hypothetical protein